MKQVMTDVGLVIVETDFPEQSVQDFDGEVPAGQVTVTILTEPVGLRVRGTTAEMLSPLETEALTNETWDLIGGR